MSQSNVSSGGQVISLSDFRRKKDKAPTQRAGVARRREDKGRGKESPASNSLLLSHLEGKVVRRPEADRGGKGLGANGAGFDDRLLKIRSSLERINNLMAELKKVSRRVDDKNPTKK